MTPDPRSLCSIGVLSAEPEHRLPISTAPTRSLRSVRALSTALEHKLRGSATTTGD
jgi:hypothetical protein